MRTDMPSWVYAKPGDLSVEIVARKTGNVLGHSYLNGNAIQCNRYTDPQSGWFEPCEARLVELPTVEKLKPKTVEDFQKAMIEAVIEMKYADFDIQAFEFQCARVEDPKQVAEFLVDCARYKPEKDDLIVRSDVLGVVTKGKGRSQTTIVLHFQAPDKIQDHAAGPFQAGLLLSSLKRRNGQ
jgi:hypothetical protein